MRLLLFFQEEKTRRVLERAARTARVPLTIHQIEDGQEDPEVVSCGRACEACRYTLERPGGRAACAASRMEHGEIALRQERAIPFMCHMGFNCVTAPVLPGLPYRLTFGPYFPIEAAEGIDGDPRKLWADQIARRIGHLPFSIKDIAAVSAETLFSVVEWTCQDVAELWRAAHAAELAARDQEEHESPVPVRIPPPYRHKGDNILIEPYHATDLAIAVAGRRRLHVRSVFKGLLRETQAGAQPNPAVRRARIVAAVAAVLEAAERTVNADTNPAWKAYAQFVREVQNCELDREMIARAMDVLFLLRPAKPRAARKPGTEPLGQADYKQLNKLLLTDLTKTPKLETVAEELGYKSNTLCKHLKRKYRMSYSEYLGRLRIDKAKGIIRETRLTLTEVAKLVGVKDQSHFSKLFRKFEGVTPSDYRRRFGK